MFSNMTTTKFGNKTFLKNPCLFPSYIPTLNNEAFFLSLIISCHFRVSRTLVPYLVRLSYPHATKLPKWKFTGIFDGAQNNPPDSRTVIAGGIVSPRMLYGWWAPGDAAGSLGTAVPKRGCTPRWWQGTSWLSWHLRAQPWPGSPWGACPLRGAGYCWFDTGRQTCYRPPSVEGLQSGQLWTRWCQVQR